jgi:hypothetical protein
MPVTQALDESQVDVDDDKVATELVAVEAPYGTRLGNDLDAEGCAVPVPVMVNEYIADICVYFKQIEVRISPLIVWTASSAHAAFLWITSSSVSPASSSPPAHVV